MPYEQNTPFRMGKNFKKCNFSYLPYQTKDKNAVEKNTLKLYYTSFWDYLGATL
jgi:hypothetical protein